MINSVLTRIRKSLKYEELDSELQEVIQRCFVDQFVKKIKVFLFLSLVSVTILGGAVATGKLEMDSDISARLRILPIIFMIAYLVLTKGDFRQVYKIRSVVLPVYAVISTELVLTSQGLSQLFFLGI